MPRFFRHSLLVAVVFACGGCGNGADPKVKPPGDPASSKTDALKAGAAALQAQAPVQGLDIYLAGFHPLKDDPKQQMEAHHYCRQTNEDFAQCALYDANGPQANLTGIEYIISEKLYATLPEAERRYWHPHNGETLSGQLVAPGIPDAAEKELMRRKMNSYGKTWHVWMTDRGDKLPLGDPRLAWSFNRDGELRTKLLEERDRKLGVNTIDKRRSRAELVTAAKPQSGVDALNGKFNTPVTDIPGVVEAGSGRKK